MWAMYRVGRAIGRRFDFALGVEDSFNRGARCDLGPAGQAAAEDQNPWVVIEQLELAGYTVNLDRIGSAPIEDCVVTEVRNPQQVTQPVTVIDKDKYGVDIDTVEVIVRQSISVTLDCTG